MQVLQVYFKCAYVKSLFTIDYNTNTLHHNQHLKSRNKLEKEQN